MRQIRIAFFAGLISLVVSAGLLALAFFLGQPASGTARVLHNLLALAALLLASGGGFLALSTGPVLLVCLLTSPRVAKARRQGQ